MHIHSSNRFQLRPQARAAALGLALFVVTSTQPALAAPLSWNNAAGGSAASSGNWNPVQVPTPADDLTFNLNATYGVTFNAAVPTVNTHKFKRGTVTLSITSPHTATAGVDVGDANGDDADLTLASGDLTVNATINVGDASGSTGIFTIDGSDAALSLIGDASDLSVGRAGEGTLEVFGGADVIVGDDFIIGAVASGIGQATISGGSGSLPNLNRSSVQTTSASGDIIVGNNGEGTLSLLNGGLVNSARDIKIATTSGSAGLVEMSGFFSIFGSSIIATNNLDVARNDSVLAAGTAVLTLDTGAGAFIDGAIRIGDAHGGTGTVELTGGFLNSDAGIDIQSNGTLSGTGTINADITNLGDIEPTGTNGLEISGILQNTTSNSIVGTKIHFADAGGYSGTGTCNVAITGDITSSITPTGTLAIGNNTTAGFSYLGSLNVGGNIVTLVDSNGAVLGGLTTFNSGRIECASGVGVQNGASIKGDGLIVGDVTTAGVLDPHTDSASGGLITIQGDLHVNPTGIVDIAIGDTPQSGDNDRINVSGTATFGGTLRVSLKNGFIPKVGQQFIAVNATQGRTGEFTNVVVTNGADTPCNEVTFVDVYSSTAAIILIRPPLGCTALGDLNSDGGCNGPDIQIFVDSMVNGPYDSCADLNGNCENDLDDVTIFLNCLL
ncbi:MAG TPA: hypothetical protein VNT79_08310 [Phycisphaerae bacterium]|nr:hypothetical protein [Phycisphaerae bacterium]